MQKKYIDTRAGNQPHQQSDQVTANFTDTRYNKKPVPVFTIVVVCLITIIIVTLCIVLFMMMGNTSDSLLGDNVAYTYVVSGDLTSEDVKKKTNVNARIYLGSGLDELYTINPMVVDSSMFYNSSKTFNPCNFDDRMFTLMFHNIVDRKLSVKEQFTYNLLSMWIQENPDLDKKSKDRDLTAPIKLSQMLEGKITAYSYYTMDKTKGFKGCFYDPWLDRLNIIMMTEQRRTDEASADQLTWLKVYTSDPDVRLIKDPNPRNFIEHTRTEDEAHFDHASRYIHRYPQADWTLVKKKQYSTRFMNVCSGIPTDIFTKITGVDLQAASFSRNTGIDLLPGDYQIFRSLLKIYLPLIWNTIELPMIDKTNDTKSEASGSNIQILRNSFINYVMAPSILGGANFTANGYNGYSLFDSCVLDVLQVVKPTSIHIMGNCDVPMYWVSKYSREVHFTIQCIQNLSQIHDSFFSPFTLLTSLGDGTIYFGTDWDKSTEDNVNGHRIQATYTPCTPIGTACPNVTLVNILRVSPRINIQPMIVDNRMYLIPFTYHGYGSAMYAYIGIEDTQQYPRLCFIPGDCNYILTTWKADTLVIQDNNVDQKDLNFSDFYNYKQIGAAEANAKAILQHRVLLDKHIFPLHEYTMSWNDSYAVYGWSADEQAYIEKEKNANIPNG